MHQLIYRMNCDDVFTHIESEETKTYKKKKKTTDERSDGMEHKTRGRIPTPKSQPPSKKKWRWAIKHTRFCQH